MESRALVARKLIIEQRRRSETSWFTKNMKVQIKHLGVHGGNQRKTKSH